MSYDTLRKSAFSHRSVAAAAMFFVILVVTGAGIVTAEPKQDPGPIVRKDERYRLNYSVARMPNDQMLIRTRVIDSATGDIMGEPSVTTRQGEKATLRIERSIDGETREVLIEVDTGADGAVLTMTVRYKGEIEQISRNSFATPIGETAVRFTGAPLSLNLSNADIRDVLRVFEQITGIEMEVAPEVQGMVTVNATDTPWDQAFDETLRNAGYSYRFEGKKIVVFKP